jgi:hypothetical protein
MLAAGLVCAQNTPSAQSNEVDLVGQKLEATKADVEKFKIAWDKARLETTLYEQRAKRAYQKWVKATKLAKAKAQSARDKADLELQLSVERRKLAFSQWQAAQMRQTAQEAQLKALNQDRDTKAIQDKIKQLQTKLSPLVTAVPGPKQ